MAVKKSIKDNALLMRVFYEHKAVAVVLLARMERVSRNEEPGTTEWQVMNIIISHKLKGWQLALVGQYLPKQGRMAGWVLDDDQTLENRLANVYEAILRTYATEITLAEVKASWAVSLHRFEMELASVAYDAGVSWEDGRVVAFNEPKRGEED